MQCFSRIEINRDTLTYVTFLMQFINVILVFALLQHLGLTTNFEPIVTTAYWNPVLSGTWKQVLLPHNLCSWLCKCLCSADSAYYQPLVPQMNTYYIPINDLSEQQSPIFISKFTLTGMVSFQIVSEKLQIETNNVQLIKLQYCTFCSLVFSLLPNLQQSCLEFKPLIFHNPSANSGIPLSYYILQEKPDTSLYSSP